MFMKELALISLLAIPAMAITVAPCSGSGCDYHYVLSLTGLTGVSQIDNGLEDTNTADNWNFTFDTVGPLQIHAAPGTLVDASSTGTPIFGWTPGSPVTSSAGGFTNGFSDNGTDPTIDIYFQDTTADSNSGMWVDYRIVEPNAFWLNPGGPVVLAPGAVTYTINGQQPPAILGQPVALFDIAGPNPTCSNGGCTVTASTTFIPTPEPGSLALMCAAGAILGFALFRKRAALKN